MKLTTLIFLLSFTTLSVAQTQNQSIMFKDKGDDQYGHLTKIPENNVGTQDDECMEMSRQIEQLKGKLQRRYAMMEQYRMECQRQ